jgi:hypothetical protein
MPTTPSTSDLLAQLDQAEARVANVTTENDYLTQKAQIEAGLVENAQTKDARKREIQDRILKATLKTLETTKKTDQADIAEQLQAFNDAAENLSKEWTNLNKPLPEDDARIAAADQKIADAETELAEAKDSFLFKKSKIADAMAAIAKAKADKELTVKSVKNDIRARLKSQSTEKSLQLYLEWDAKFRKVGQEGLVKIDEQVKILGEQKQKAFKVKIEAAALVTKFEKEIALKEEEIKQEAEIFATIPTTTQEWQIEDQKMSNLKTQLLELQGKRNEAFMVLSAKEKAVREEEVQESTQIKIKQTQRIWIMKSLALAEERAVIYRSWLSMMQRMSEQEMLAGTDAVGTDLDKRGLMYSAEATEATQNNLMAMIKDLPSQRNFRDEVRKTQIESEKRFADQLDEAVRRFKEQHNEDPDVPGGIPDGVGEPTVPAAVKKDSVEDLLSSLR